MEQILKRNFINKELKAIYLFIEQMPQQCITINCLLLHRNTEIRKIVYGV